MYSFITASIKRAINHVTLIAINTWYILYNQLCHPSEKSNLSNPYQKPAMDIAITTGSSIISIMISSNLDFVWAVTCFKNLPEIQKITLPSIREPRIIIKKNLQKL